MGKVIEIAVVTIVGLAVWALLAYLLYKATIALLIHLPSFWYRIWFKVLPGGEARRQRYRMRVRRKRREMLEKVDAVIAGEIEVSDAKLASLIFELSSYERLHEYLSDALGSVMTGGEEQDVRKAADSYYEAVVGITKSQTQENRERLDELLKIQQDMRDRSGSGEQTARRTRKD